MGSIPFSQLQFHLIQFVQFQFHIKFIDPKSKQTTSKSIPIQFNIFLYALPLDKHWWPITAYPISPFDVPTQSTYPNHWLE